MKSHAVYGLQIGQTGAATPCGAPVASVASVSGSDKMAPRLGVMLRRIAATGIVATLLYPAPSEAQEGSLGNSASQNSAQVSMANSIRTVCPNLTARQNAPDRSASETQLNTVCTDMVQNNFGLSQEGLNGATQTINGEEVLAMQQQVGDVGATQVANIAARMDAIRAGMATPGLSVAGLTLDDGEQILTAGYEDDVVAGQGDSLVGEGGALSTPIWDKLGVFVTGAGLFGDKSSSGKVTGYDFYSIGLTAGADYRVRDDFVVGGAVGYSYYDVDFDDESE